MLTEGLIALTRSLTVLGHTHSSKGRPPIHNDFLSKLLSCIFLDNKAFQDNPEWSKQQISTLSGLLMDAYMEGYAQA